MIISIRDPICRRTSVYDLIKRRQMLPVCFWEHLYFSHCVLKTATKYTHSIVVIPTLTIDLVSAFFACCASVHWFFFPFFFFALIVVRDDKCILLFHSLLTNEITRCSAISSANNFFVL